MSVNLHERFVLVDQAADGSPRFLTRHGSLSDQWREACLFWTEKGARDAVPWHDLDHMRVLRADIAYQVVPELEA